MCFTTCCAGIDVDEVVEAIKQTEARQIALSGAVSWRPVTSP